MCSGHICRCGAIAGRMACMLAVVVLTCVSVAYGQVIEEGGFLVKGGGVSGEPFSLSCPSRLVVEAGESVLLSCSATAVPEEGVRYEWESLSGDGLYFLSDANERSPLFTAPVSGEGAEYAYRLTAMSVGVYETATVTVSVEVVSGGSVQDRGKSPGLLEGCDSFGALEGFREGCVGEDKAPGSFEPFEGGFEGEEGPGLLFPEAPGLPDRPSGPIRGGGPGRQTPPRLECPVAVFLEELEIGSIECHVSDALGEEFLEYMWEPVGSTTRDYLDNPRLIPEDAPNPSVVAPEAPAYETLESFHSGETTFRYRYRLTATSRATGLSSSSEVEVYVSSSRPSLYCPLEVVVEEGETIALDCEGVDPLSARMDYDEEGASILWEWEGLWGTSTAPLAATHLPSPLFTAPLGSAGKQYHYIASMTSSASGVPRMARRRVTVRVTGAEEGAQAAADDSALMFKGSTPVITCNDSEVYEATADFTLDCSVTDEPSGATYAWTVRGSTSDTDDLTNTDSLRATFSVPDNIDADTDYEYTVTLSASGIDDVTEDVTVTVRNKPDITVTCEDSSYDVDEGAEDIELECEALGAPGDDPQYTWSWSPTTHLTGHDTAMPTFDVPDDVDNDTIYTYTVTASAANANDGTAEVTVKVREMYTTAIHCPGNPYSVDEGSDRYELDCWVENPPTNVARDYRFTSLSSNGALDLLDYSRGDSPILYFTAPASVDANTTYKYTFTISIAAPGLVRAIASRDFSVTVRDTDSTDPVVTCSDSEAYEATADFTLNCSVTNEPSGATYAWTGTDIANRLSSTTILKPTFNVPGSVNADTEYDYTVTLSASGIDDITADVTVTVLEKPDITCSIESYNGPGSITFYQEGGGSFRLPACPENDLLPARIPRSNFIYSWTGTSDIDLLSATNVHSPTFNIPENLSSSKDYVYRLQVSAPGENVDPRNRVFRIRISDRPDITVTCEDSPYEVDEGDADIDFACEASGAPGDNPDYTWSWSPTANLTGHDTDTPTFDVPGDVDQDTTYTYTVTATADNADDGTASVTVTVLNTPPSIACTATPDRVYEGSGDDITVSCSAQNTPSVPFIYGWEGSDLFSTLLIGWNQDWPIFRAPDNVNGDTEYVFTVNIYIGHNGCQPDLPSCVLDSVATADVTITVLEKPDIAVTCSGNPYTVDEGDGLALDCAASGAPGSNPQYTWSWSPVDRLTDHDTGAPVFSTPADVDQDTTWTYRVTATADNADDGTAEVTVTVRDTDSTDPSLTCNDSEVYEGTADFTLDCEVTNEPTGATYAWTSESIYGADLLSRAPILNPRFSVPDNIPGGFTDDFKRIYRYTVTMSATDISDITADVTVTVLEKPNIRCGDKSQLGAIFTRDEGGSDFPLLVCKEGWTRAPGANPVYTYAWTARGSTANTDLLSATNIESPTFDVPDAVDENETYTYTLTVSAENADDISVQAAVVVRDTDSTDPVITCNDAEVYEDTADFTLDCSVTDEPTGATYAWTARGSTSGTGQLGSTTILKPTFDVPPNVDADTDYEYTVTLSASGIDDVTEDVTVAVLNKPSLTLVCAPVAPVYEGAADFDLNCSVSGAPSGSVPDFVWTARGATSNTDLLIAGTDGPTPTFDVPEEVDSDETYEYTLTVSADNAEDATANVTVTVLNKPSLTLVCAPVAPVYEGAADFDLDCSVSGAPSSSGYNFVWTARGSTANTDLLISGTDGPTPTLDVPEEVDSDETYEYTLTVSADNAESATEDVTVTVLNKKALEVACATPSPVYEESEDFALDCVATGAPAGSDYKYVWTGRGTTTNTDLLVSGTNGPTPTFDVPEEVDEDETYEYLLTVSAENAIDATAEVTVTVLKLGSIALICASPPLVYEGSEDFELDCSILGDTGDTDYTYEWTARGATTNTDQLSATNIPSPTFDVPDALDRATTYEYLLTASAENAESASAAVAVTVLNRGALSVVCVDPPSVYEGSADFDLDCLASDAPAGSAYAYVWTARGSTANTALLIAGTDGPTPTFAVPDALDATTTYEYLLTASAENAEDATAEVTVTVLNRGTLDVACAPPPLVYEGAEDFALDCSILGDTGDTDYTYEWTARGATTNTDQLSATNIPSPTFDVPDALDRATTYEYLLTASAENAESASAAVAVTVLNRGALSVVCVDPPSVYEGSADFDLDCSASDAPAGSAYAYVWTARGSTANTALLIAGTDGPTPTFSVPDALDETTTYEYLLTASAENAEDGVAEVMVTVLNAGALRVVCADPPSAYEGSADLALDCSASGAPAGSEYAYVWTGRGTTANTDELSAVDISSPTFYVPDEVDETTTYEYLLTVSAENAESGSAEVTVTVLDRGALSVVCADPPSIYEGSEDFALDCSASGAPAGSGYSYAWTARGSTVNTDQLSRADISSPTFYVPDEVEETTTYEYLLTASAENMEDGAAEVTVTVLNRGALSVVCMDPGSVYEGSEDITLDCTASGTPAGSDYSYVWSARGSTANTDLLISGTDGPSPTFAVPDEVHETTTYEYLLTVSAENAESGSAEVTVTVLDRGALSVVCADPPSIYEGSEDFALDCSASGAPAGSGYSYAWTARGSTVNTDQLSRADISSPTFYVPDEVEETTTYEYLLTASAENMEDGAAEVTVTVLNRGALSVVCMNPGSVYEGSEDITLDCTASGAPAGSEYAYVWTAQGDTENTLQLSATDIPSPTFYVPDAVDVTTHYEYLLTVSVENAEDASAEVVVTVLKKETLAVVCTDPGSVYEGSEDFAFDCTASGAPAGPEYTYVWTARASTANTDLLSRVDISSPTFYVPDDVDTTTTYKYLLTASADNAEDASAEVMVTVLDRVPLALDDAIAGRVYIFTVGEVIADILPEATGGLPPYTYTLEPMLPRGLSLKVDGDTTRTISGTPLEVSPRTEYTWQVTDANAETAQIAFSIEVVPAEEPTSVPVAETSSELPEPSSLGVTASASSLRFGVQSADTQVSLDPMTDQISTRVSGPYHAGRMTLSLDGSEALDENGEMDLSIELASPVVLRRERGIKATSIVLAPQWSLAESCEQLSSQAIGGLYTEVTLSEADCRLLRFGGELDLTDVPSGQYTGSLDIILRSGESEETHSVDVEVRVVPAQRVITIGPGGVRFSTSREIPAGLTEEQNLSIYPHVAFLTEEKPHGVFELSNPSLIPLEVSVSTRFGYTEATADGREAVVEDSSGSHLGDLSQVVDIHPGILVLRPGEKGLVRYGVKEEAHAAMAEKGYAAFFDVVSEPRQYVRTDQMPEEVTGDRTARVTMRVPGVYVPAEGASQLRATLLSISFVGSMSATFLLETEDHPFVGEVVAYDGDGRELGRRETLVYTRSRVRVPLDRIPEEGAVFLRFAPRGSGRVPEPASVEWDAPRRDIGAAEDKDRATTTETLARKP